MIAAPDVQQHVAADGRQAASTGCDINPMEAAEFRGLSFGEGHLDLRAHRPVAAA